MHLTNYTVNKKSSKFVQNQGQFTGDAADAANASGNSPAKHTNVRDCAVTWPSIMLRPW